ncbi:MAG: divergent PAP2 family protein [Anaerorhabdus sp.]|uniref:divergent PAP2 family protein n=1 Tax=Anaerorhabdus sp. TaxID=1872524 RepID=UPI003A841977
MIRELNNMFPFWACLIAIVTAQIAKPVFVYFKTKQWDWSAVFASGGYPSSHTAGVAALSLAVGIQEHFSSTIFAVSLAFALIVTYDAANVRYYAGRNIQITQQLIKDIQALTQTKLEDPIYLTKVKEVLGHKWIEVIGGIFHGIVVAGVIYLLGVSLL